MQFLDIRESHSAIKYIWSGMREIVTPKIESRDVVVELAQELERLATQMRLRLHGRSWPNKKRRFE